MYIFAQINATADPVRFAVTSPHHAPGRPISSVMEKSHANGGVNMMVRKMVTIRAFIPFPVPWNMDEESIPKAIPGKNMHTVLRKIMISVARYAEVSARVNNMVINGAKEKINNAITASMIMPIFKACMYEMFSFL